MPKLTDLDAKLIRYEERPATGEVIVGDYDTWHARGCPTKEETVQREWRVTVEKLADAQGVQFQCPKCLKSNGHYVSITFAHRDVPDHLGSINEDDEPTRWRVTGGTGLHDLSTQPSIWLKGTCGWHGFITNGEAK